MACNGAMGTRGPTAPGSCCCPGALGPRCRPRAPLAGQPGLGASPEGAVSPQSRSPAGRAGGRAAQAGKTSNCLPGCRSRARRFAPICLLSCPPTDLTIILMPICLIAGFSIPPSLAEILQEFQFGIRLLVSGIGIAGLPFFPVPPAKALTAGAAAAQTQRRVPRHPRRAAPSKLAVFH